MADVNLEVDFGTVYLVDKGSFVKIVADRYSAEQTYAVGDYAIHNELLYKCITAIDEPEEFDAEKWVQVKLADEVENKADANNVYTKSETDTALATKANTADVDTALAGKANIEHGIYTVKSTNTTSSTNGRWTGNIDVPELYNGLTIRYLTTRHTQVGNIGAENSVLLNLTLSDGTDTDYVEVFFDRNTPVKEEYQIDEIVTLTYFEPASSPTGDYAWVVQRPTVVQQYTTENKNLPVLMGEAPNDSLKQNNCGTKRNNSFTYNPSTGNLSVSKVNGYTLGDASAKGVDTTVTENSMNLVTSGAVFTAIDNLPEPMVFKGTLGTNGTITTLPSASASNTGYTYKVITADTYQGLVCKVGDVVTSNGSEWVLIPSGDTDSDTWRNIKVNGTEKLSSGISSGAVDFVDSTNIKMAFDADGNKISATLDGVYTSAQVDTALQAKADANNVYTKSETYTKTQVDNITNAKADANTVYTKDETYTKAQVDEKIDNLPEPMIFKGTLGVGGTIETLPTASASNEGWTYKVITAGTYAGQTAKVGDSFTSDGSTWVLFPCGDTDTDTWRAIKVNGVEKLGNGISSGSVDIVEGDNINITFDADGNKVEIEADTIDDTQALTTKSWSGKKTYDEIVNILPTGNASGSIANFNTSLALPMEIVADVNASGGGGTPATPIPIVGVSAVNVYQTSNYGQYFGGLAKGTYAFVDLGSLTWSTGATSQSGKFRFIANIPNLKLNTSATSKPNIISPNYNAISPNDAFNCVKGVTCSTSDTLIIIYDDTYASGNIPNFTNAMQGVYAIFELTNAVTPTITPEQFATLCTAFGINGTTQIINLGGTYYGGQVEIDKNGHRRFKVTHNIVDLSTLNWNVDLANRSRSDTLRQDIAIPPQTEEPNCIAEKYIGIKANSTLTSGHFAILPNVGTLIFYRDGTETPTGNFVYEIAEPYYIDITDGEPINSLVGVNNVYNDSGNTEVTYKKSIDDAIAELQALILS